MWAPGCIGQSEKIRDHEDVATDMYDDKRKILWLGFDGRIALRSMTEVTGVMKRQENKTDSEVL